MSAKIIDELVDRQKGWLDPLGRALVAYVRRAREALGAPGAQVFDFLHGVWLDHPLHPALTDVPLGAWTVGAVLDTVDTFAPNKVVRGCADGAIALGVLGGLAAAPAGTADWHHTTGRDRRLGLAHGLLNATALLLYLASLALRRGKARPAGTSLSLFAYGVASLAAYLGGELVYGRGIGVNHALWQRPPADFVPVLREDELAENQPRKVMAGDVGVVLVKRHGHIHALAATCTHLGGPLAEGELKDETIVCPWHFSQFALASGDVVHGPATFGEQIFEVRVRDGQIEVRPQK